MNNLFSFFPVSFSKAKTKAKTVSTFLRKALCLCGVVFLFGATSLHVFSQSPTAISQSQTVKKAGSSVVQKPLLTVSDCAVKMVHHVVLSSDRPGLLATIAVKEQDEVDAKSIVAQLRNDEAKALVETSKKEAENDNRILAAQKSHALSKNELEVALKSKDKGQKLFTDFEIDRLKLTENQSELSVKQAQYEQELAKSQLKQAEARLKSHDIKTPIKGFVSRIYKHAGEVIEQGAPIVEISNVETLKITGLVSALETLKIKPGYVVEVRHRDEVFANAVGNPVLKGTIKFVDVSVAKQISGRVRIWAEVENPKRLLMPGQHATMTIFAPVTSPPSKKSPSSKK